MVNKDNYCVLIGLQNRFAGPVWCCDNGNSNSNSNSQPVIVIALVSRSHSPSRSPSRVEPCLARRVAVRLARQTVLCSSNRRLPSPSRSPSSSHSPRASNRVSRVVLPFAVLASRTPSSSPSHSLLRTQISKIQHNRQQQGRAILVLKKRRSTKL